MQPRLAYLDGCVVRQRLRTTSADVFSIGNGNVYGNVYGNGREL